MLPRLKSLELHGFKTFASRIEFSFAGMVTAIVGPNGSGKSNIADAIRWVLGEQSYSLLRAKKTEDMIFSGSDQRPRAGMAAVTIVFDNSDGWLPIDFNEVAITRRAYRDGQNDYLINKQRVRLRDISELLAQSGLAERTYTIIGQGLVDVALALKADERRRLFEEAAGIGLHRARREEALRRLDITHRNLERVEDILTELQPRLRSLDRQARRIQEYEHIRADLRLLLRDYYGYYWRRSQREFGDAIQVVRQQEEHLNQTRSNQQGLDIRLESYYDQIQSLRDQLNDWRSQVADLHSQREEISRELAIMDERQRYLVERQQVNQIEQFRLENEVAYQRERLTAVRHEVERIQAALVESRQAELLAQQALESRQAERSQVESAIDEARQSLANLMADQARVQEGLAERNAQIERQQSRLVSAQHEIVSLQEELANAKENHLQAVARVEQAHLVCQEVEISLQSMRSQMVELDASLQQMQANRTEIQARQAQQRAQLEVLEQAEKNLTGYADGARLLLQAIRRGRISGYGALSNALEVPAQYEVAIAAALGEYLDAIVFYDSNPLEMALDLLGKETARGVLLPMDQIHASIGTIPQSLDTTGLVGIAADLVQAVPEAQPVVKLLLGSVLLIKDRATARSILPALESQKHGISRLVTLQGEIFSLEGPVFAGHDGKPGLLSRSRQRRQAQEGLAQTHQELDAQYKDLHDLEIQREQLAMEERRLRQNLGESQKQERNAQNNSHEAEMVVERIRQSMAWQQDLYSQLQSELTTWQCDIEVAEQEKMRIASEIEAMRESLSKLNAQLVESLSLDDEQSFLSYWKTQIAVQEQVYQDAQSRLEERQATVHQVEMRLEQLKAQIIISQEDLKALIQKIATAAQSEKSLNNEIESLSLLIHPAETNLESLENEQTQLRLKEAESRQALSLAEHTHAQARINLARLQESLDSLRRRIEDDLGLVAFHYEEQISGPTPLPLDGLVEQLPNLKEIPVDLDENIQLMRNQLRRMEPINLEAQAEYQEVKNRFDFMTEQVADLIQAEKDIKEVLIELDIQMERAFRQTFESVAQEFRQIFTRMFGGGSARLVLTSENLADAGIDIEARLPGRREQGLSLLSGGERSLTATALVFALLKVSPTPFCLLDEVDAMLDEANVGRFRDLLRELSAKTQFVIVTHNRNTVQAADVIYGVTMGADSTSQVISLKMDEVARVVD